jgi:signal transduction histidine kinase/AmiR/NasT family two-component response regulator
VALPGEVALRRRCAEEAWPAHARYNRVFGLSCGAVMLLAWSTDVAILGVTPFALGLLALRVVHALTMLPLLVGAFRPRRPPWFERAQLLVVAGVPALLVVLITLKPTTIAIQGWTMVFAWVVLGLGVHAPLRKKLWLGLATYLLYAAHLAYVVGRLHGAYAKPNEIVSILLVGALGVFWAPFVPHRTDEGRLQEHRLRAQLEAEVELRREREQALEVTKDAAQQAEREAMAQKARAEEAASEARAAAKTAEREARLRTALLANMSHDLRTPMAGILGLVELMHATALSEEQRGYIETIRASNQTLLSLLNDILDFSRIDEGKLPILRVPAALAHTLRAPADLLRATAERKGLSFSVEIAGDLPAHALIDPVRVQQILLNLLGNAVKFTDRGGVTYRAWMKQGPPARSALPVGPQSQSTLCLEVSDTGIGFSEEQAAKLFDRFQQAEDSIGHKYGGSGLGLSICKGLVALMDGTIAAEGIPHGGARFRVELPVEEAVPPSVLADAAEVPSMRVLLAEDNPVNQMVLSLMLKSLGQSVSVAGEGRHALRMLLENRYDLAILDMQMPGLNGDEVVRTLRACSAATNVIHVVALTAGATPEERQKYFEAGVDAIYVKPIDLNGLRHLLVKEGALALARLRDVGKLFSPRTGPGQRLQ